MSSFECAMQQSCCQSCQQATLAHFFSYLRTEWNKALCVKCSLLFFRVTLVSKLYSSGLSSGHSPRCYLANTALCHQSLANFQIIALVWFMIGYIPGGATGMKYLTKLCTSLCRKTVTGDSGGIRSSLPIWKILVCLFFTKKLFYSLLSLHWCRNYEEAVKFLFTFFAMNPFKMSSF